MDKHLSQLKIGSTEISSQENVLDI